MRELVRNQHTNGLDLHCQLVGVHHHRDKGRRSCTGLNLLFPDNGRR